MTRNQENKQSRQWLWNIPRVFVGLILLSTGIGKGLDIHGFVAVLEAYQLFPHWLSVVLAYFLPVFELIVAICLLIAVQRIPVAWMTVGFHVLMLSVVVFTLIRGTEITNCGCFGVFLARPLTVATAIEDIVMLVMSLLVLFDARQRVNQAKSSPSEKNYQP